MFNGAIKIFGAMIVAGVTLEACISGSSPTVTTQPLTIGEITVERLPSETDIGVELEATLTPTQAIFGATQKATLNPIPKLPHCTDRLIVFVASGDDLVNNGIYAACPETKAIIYVMPTSRFGFGIQSMDVAPDGKALLFSWSNVDHISEVANLDLDWGVYTPVLEQDIGKAVCCVQWSPDGLYVSYVSHFDGDLNHQDRPDVIEFLNVERHLFSKINHESKQNYVPISHFLWFPDGQNILYIAHGVPGTDANGPYWLNIACTNETGRCGAVGFPHPIKIGADPSIRPDGLTIVSITGHESNPKGTLSFTNLSNTTESKIEVSDFGSQLEFIRNPVYSRDGQQVAFVARSSVSGVENIYVLDLRNQSLINLTENKMDRVYFGPLDW